jgi:hypothetical protein
MLQMDGAALTISSPHSLVTFVSVAVHDGEPLRSISLSNLDQTKVQAVC